MKNTIYFLNDKTNKNEMKDNFIIATTYKTFKTNSCNYGKKKLDNVKSLNQFRNKRYKVTIGKETLYIAGEKNDILFYLSVKHNNKKTTVRKIRG